MSETVASFCRNCGKALSDDEKAVPGTIYCAACAPAQASPPLADPVPSPAAAPPIDRPSPGLAFLLGLMIPGVGAIYNAQYVKGLIHVIIFGMLLAITDDDHGLHAVTVPMIPAWILYMAFEAYHTAKRRAAGLPVDEFSSLFPIHGSAPVLPILLILSGGVFLANNLGLFRIEQLLRFWPVLLIVLGGYMLWARARGPQPGAPSDPPPFGGSGQDPLSNPYAGLERFDERR